MRALIVDDESLSRKRIRQLLPADLGVEVIGECSNGLDAIDAVRAQRPDVLFLDVQMPELSGFDVLAALEPDEQPIVIFTTAYDEYAVKAFEVCAFDYLLKPIEPQRLRRACERVRDRLENERSSDTGNTAPVPGALAPMRDRLVVRTGNGMTLLKTCDIRWVEAAGNYVRLHTTNGSHLVREKLVNLLHILDANIFVRVHRSTIVNIEHVSSLQPWFSGEMIVFMDDGTQLKLSRTYRRELENRVYFLS